MEPEIARVAASSRNDGDLEKLRKDIEAMKAFVGEPADWARLDMNFHLNIAHATQNNLLPLMLKPVFRLMPEIKSKIMSDVPEARESAIIWHSKILQAIVNGDPEQAYSEMKQHLVIAREHAERMMKVEGMIDTSEPKKNTN